MVCFPRKPGKRRVLPSTTSTTSTSSLISNTAEEYAPSRPKPRALDPLLVGEQAQGRSRKFFLIDQFDLLKLTLSRRQLALKTEEVLATIRKVALESEQLPKKHRRGSKWSPPEQPTTFELLRRCL